MYIKTIIFRHVRFVDYHNFKISRQFSTKGDVFSQPHNIYEANGKDPAPIFFNPQTQGHLRCLTRLDINKVYRRRKLGEKYLQTPEYKFLTKQQLDEHLKDAFDKVEQLLQMPPIVRVRQPIDKILNEDPYLKNHDADNAKLVFIDISVDVTDRERLIVTREPNGVLRHADWDMRRRMNQIFNPQAGRELSVPIMFRDYHALSNILARNEHEFVMDRACVQFDPDDEHFQTITSLTYEHLNSQVNFEQLRSTRHFGPMAFYLSWFNKIDNLLIDLLETRAVDEVMALLRLYYTIHEKQGGSSDLYEMLDDFVGRYSTKKGEISLAVKAFKEYESVGRGDVVAN